VVSLTAASPLAIGALQSDIIIPDLNILNAEGILAALQSRVLLGGGYNWTYGASGIVASQSEVSLAVDSLTGDGPCLQATEGANIYVTANALTSNLQTVALCADGGEIRFDDGAVGLTFTAPAGDGVDCTGGGKAYFKNVTQTFVVAGDELIVGPGALEQSSYALALPNPGDSFSNAGAGSTMTRLT
jgi:hypothetical protein